MTITVANVKTHRGPGVYIGRRVPARGLAGSPLANPFRLGREATRPQVIEKYREWLMWRVEKYPNNPAAVELKRLLRAVLAGDDVVLLCWCHPLACHGDVIKEHIEQHVQLLREVQA